MTFSPIYCGTTDDGVPVFASPDFLATTAPYRTPADAVRYAASYARCHPGYGTVVAAEITDYGQRDFGPSGRYWLGNGVVGWFACPGGMRHGGFYNVVPGVGPAPAIDLYPIPVKDAAKAS